MWLLEPVIVTSVANLTNEKVTTVFPNPSGGDFNLFVDGFDPNEKISVSIFDITRQVKFFDSYFINRGFNNVTVKTGNILSPGNYFVVAKGSSSVVRARLIIYR